MVRALPAGQVTLLFSDGHDFELINAAKTGQFERTLIIADEG